LASPMSTLPWTLEALSKAIHAVQHLVHSTLLHTIESPAVDKKPWRPRRLLCRKNASMLHKYCKSVNSD
jgi:hypothetical protein